MTDISSLLNQAYDDIRPVGSGRYLEVGKNKAFKTVQDAAKASRDGDTIVVHSGTYTFAGDEHHARYNDSAPILIEHSLQIVGLGEALFNIGDVSKGALVTAGSAKHLYVENITFQGAHNSDLNGAGIRHQEGDLTVVDSTFKNNNNGILGGDKHSAVKIFDSEFDTNGHGDGRSHGIYINKTEGASLLVENSHFHDTKIGHHIKSLASNTVVRGNLLDDADGTASMAIDVTAGGDLLVEDNTIIQSAKSDNPKFIYYSTARNNGEEGDVIVRGNVFQNFYNGGEVFGNATDRMVIDFQDNEIIDPSGKLKISGGYYNSFGNTYNGDLMREGGFAELSVPEDLVIPPSLATVMPAPPFRYAEGPGGIYIQEGWGAATMNGTPADDVLEAISKGLKTMVGGGGDDLYLLNGQFEIIEKSGQGFDWAIGGGGWSFTLPNNLEGYWNNSFDSMRMLTGNDEHNMLIGGGSGEELDGKNGDDTLFGGVGGGDTFHGGPGSDTVVFAGDRSAFRIQDDNGQLIVIHPNGNRDIVADDVEFFTFDDQTLSFDGALLPLDKDPAPQEPAPQEPAPQEPAPQEPAPQEPAPQDPAPDTGGQKYVASIPVPDIDDPEAPASDGIYLVHGWGTATLQGTDGDDVLEARSKGLKTMVGGAGDDIYLLNGQWAIEEHDGEGFDWAVGGGGWSFTLPAEVEAYWNNSTDPMSRLTGNEDHNILIGGGAGEKIDGKRGDDLMYGGGSGGDTFAGGPGADTVIFDGVLADYAIESATNSARVTYANGAVDTISPDVEFLYFADQIVPMTDVIIG